MFKRKVNSGRYRARFNRLSNSTKKINLNTVSNKRGGIKL